MRLATWNLERKKPTSPRGKEAVDYLHGRGADVLVITEARTTFPAQGGHLLFADELTAFDLSPPGPKRRSGRS